MIIFDNQITELFNQIKSDIIACIDKRFEEIHSTKAVNQDNLISVTRGAILLGVSRSTLYSWMKIQGFKSYSKDNKRYLDKKYLKKLKEYINKENKYYSNLNRILLENFVKNNN